MYDVLYTTCNDACSHIHCTDYMQRLPARHDATVGYTTNTTGTCPEHCRKARGGRLLRILSTLSATHQQRFGCLSHVLVGLMVSRFKYFKLYSSHKGLTILVKHVEYHNTQTGRLLSREGLDAHLVLLGLGAHCQGGRGACGQGAWPFSK